MLNDHEYQRLKPKFKRIISQEISKMVWKGTHHNKAIREFIRNQDIEDKTYQQFSKGPSRAQHPWMPKKLTSSKVMNLLDDSSSQAGSSVS